MEDTLSPTQRQDVLRRFEDSPVELVGLGSTFEFHALDPAVVRQNVEDEALPAMSATSAPGVVRPNGHQEGPASPASGPR